MIQEERIEKLNDRKPVNGRYVLYWMQQSQRSEYNHALEYSIRYANRIKKTVIAVFGLTPDYPEANLRHYRFMLEGLKETEENLKNRGIRLAVLLKSPDDAALSLSEDASAVICDFGYTRIQRQWRKRVSERTICPVIQVESDIIIPVRTASPKSEYSAKTLRDKINKVIYRYLEPLEKTNPEIPSVSFKIASEKTENIDKLLKKLSVDISVKPSDFFKGGYDNAIKRFSFFSDNRLENYGEKSNHPDLDYVSCISPYLHFGQVSPLDIALRIIDIKGAAPFLEQLIIRRELAVNHVYYNSNYDSYETIPGWAKISLEKHKYDFKPHLYTIDELESASTHDPYWNAAMKEMLVTGYMHNYMRMYWGKKIIEWSRTPREAYRNILYLNNRYFLDGRDPNSFTGVNWLFGLHDRGWKEREIFGKTRYMSLSGLERKFNIKNYVNRINSYC